MGPITANEIKLEYNKNVDDIWLPGTYNELNDILKSIPGVIFFMNHNGTIFWSLKPECRKHKLKEIDHEVPNKKKKMGHEGFDKENVSPTFPKIPFLDTRTPVTSISRIRGMFYNFQLIGDDFFLEIARNNLGYRVKPRPGSKAEQLHLIRSGFKLKNAANEIRNTKHLSKNLLINLGTEDIMCGRTLPDLKADFETLLVALEERKVTPIFCTLAPIANHLHDPETRQTVKSFNWYLKNQRHVLVIDLYDLFLSNEGKVKFANFN